MALGHPLGATGCKLMGTLINELERTKGSMVFWRYVKEGYSECHNR
eukprot:UN01463